MRSIALCRWGAAVLVLLAVAAGASAYDQPLSPEAVRDAYFLGRHHEQADYFLARYSQVLSSWSKRLGIVKVQLLTPYAQIVKQSRSDMLDKNSVDVDWEYRHPVLPVIVRVWFDFAPIPYSTNGIPDRLARHSSISVSQSHALQYSKISYSTLYSGGKHPASYGVLAKLTFSASQFTSAPVNVSISVPNGLHTDAAFDLTQLN